jgi:hypothetical protein
VIACIGILFSQPAIISQHYDAVLPELEFNYSHPSNVEVKNKWIYKSTPPIRLHAANREIFTFSLFSTSVRILKMVSVTVIVFLDT